MPAFALKGAVVDYPQLADRAAALVRAGLPVVLELHTFGPRDLQEDRARAACLANLDRLRAEYGPLTLTVHVPLQEVARVTCLDFDADQVLHAIAFARDAGAGEVVVHRYWGLVYGDAPPRASRAEASEGFNATIARLARLADPIRLLVENVGHYALLPRDRASFLAGPLDHFFPWEIAAFRAFLDRERIANVAPFVDVAHATLSANLFNWRRTYPAKTRDDVRFSAILDEDLERVARLHPLDFVDPKMPWLHVSDSRFYPDPALAPAEIPLDALTSEGLELGAGNLPWADLPRHVGETAVLVLEVDPAAGESHQANGAQHRSLQVLQRQFQASR